MKENRGTEAGLVTRLDGKFIYVWWKKQHLDELVFIRSINPEITCGDIVTFEVSQPSTEMQEGAKLTLLPNHCFTTHIPNDNQSTCWVRTNVILPPQRSTYFAEQEKYCEKEGMRLQFMAFSKEFGSVACCIRMDHKPDTVYSCVIERMPTKFDSKLKKKLDTLFFITEHGIKENTDAEEVSRIRKVAPWNLEATIHGDGQVKSWVNSKTREMEYPDSNSRSADAKNKRTSRTENAKKVSFIDRKPHKFDEHIQESDDEEVNDRAKESPEKKWFISQKPLSDFLHEDYTNGKEEGFILNDEIDYGVRPVKGFTEWFLTKHSVSRSLKSGVKKIGSLSASSHLSQVKTTKPKRKSKK